MGNLERTWEEIEQYRKQASDSGDFNVSAAYEKSMDIISNHMNDCWIPVDEVLPEDGRTVLCTDGEYVYLVEYDADLDAPFGELDNITHWQPSPKPYRPERSDNHDGE